MKKIFFLVALASLTAIGLSALPTITQANDSESRLSGRILINVQKNGEAWYVNPTNHHRYFMGRPADAFGLMRTLGLGITNKDFDSFNGTAPERLSGRILIKVEDSGRAYYVNPIDLNMIYLGTPADAFKVMRMYGLGITDNDLNQIVIRENQRVSIADSAFNPATVTVEKGVMVTWTNNDNYAHTLISLNNFTLGSIDSGQTYSRMFNVTGIFNYYDQGNSDVTGTVIVK